MNRGSDRCMVPGGLRTTRFNEAPIHESGKCGSGEGTPQGEHKASMRPRFMNRGSTVGVGYDPSSTDSFNEAPIHESGKSDATRHLRNQTRRFNEAPIHESGK